MLPIFAGVILLCIVLQGSAALLESTRGEWGLVVLGCVVLAAWAVQRALHREGLAEVGVQTGIYRGLAMASALSLAMAAAAALYLWMQGAQASAYSNWGWLALGILAQGGVAEELVFRGYLFGHLRRTRGFWSAAAVSMIPFAAVHLTAFATLGWPIALAAIALSITLSFPYAHLYEISGRTIWAPALLHAVTQGGPKLIVVDNAAFPVAWMGIALLLSYAVLLIPRSDKPA